MSAMSPNDPSAEAVAAVVAAERDLWNEYGEVSWNEEPEAVTRRVVALHDAVQSLRLRLNPEAMDAALTRARAEGAEAMRGACVRAAQREALKERMATDGGCCKATCKSLSRKIASALRALPLPAPTQADLQRGGASPGLRPDAGRSPASTLAETGSGVAPHAVQHAAPATQAPAGGEREAFEAWSRGENRFDAGYAMRWNAHGQPGWWLIHHAEDGGDLFIQSEYEAWNGWQARAAKGGPR